MNPEFALPLGPEEPLPSLSVVLPAYNEAENLGTVVGEVVRLLGPWTHDLEVVVVDDGSTDGTLGVAKSLQASLPALRVLSHERNQGYGAAVLDGLMGAGKAYVFFTDADRQFDLAEFSALRARVNEADMVIGYRAPRRDPLVRRVNGRLWSLLVNALFGYTARDIDCAFKLMHRGVISAVGHLVRSRGATFSAEFLIRARRAGFRVVEVPVRGHRPRSHGRATGARPGVILRAIGELLKLRWTLWKEARRRP